MVLNSPQLATRLEQIQPFYAMSLMARARELQAAGRDVINMGVGEPDFDTPPPIVAAGIAALQQGRHHYTPACGLLALREAISEYYADHFSVDVDPRRILITPGSSGALQLLMQCLINPGDQVLMTDPGYPCNRNFVRLVEGEAVTIPVCSEDNYQLNLPLLQPHWGPRSKALLLASPSNPSGTLVGSEDLKAMAAFVAQQRGHLFVDEIYQGLCYEGAVQTALSVSDELFVINSFSKFFGMTGWRLGWLVAPEAYVEALERVAQNVFLSAPTPAQYAALAAFTPETMTILEQRREEFQCRRDYLLPALKSLGFEIDYVPQGAFYLYANCHALTEDSFNFAHRLLEETAVAVTPGKDFGHYLPQHYLRFSYTSSLPRLEQAIARVAQFLKK